MSDTTYKGWNNYETWLCNQWYDNFDFTDEVEGEVFDGMDTDQIVDYVADHIEDTINEHLDLMLGESSHNTGFIDDIISTTLGVVDFREIASHYLDDILVGLKDFQEEKEKVVASVF